MSDCAGGMLGTGMNLNEILLEKRAEIIEDWRELTLRAYPEDTVRFLKKQQDPINNPVGHALTNGLSSMFDWLCEEVPTGAPPAFLEDIVRIRAVQDIRPSHAVTFVYLIKKLVRERLAENIRQGRVLQDLLAFESRVDRLALLAFDLYTESRERIHEVYKSSINREVYRFMQRANDLWGGYRNVPGVSEQTEETGHKVDRSITEEEKGLAK